MKDWFRKYDSPEGSFSDHGRFFLENKRYAEALKVGHDPLAFLQAIAKAGYATAPAYFEILVKVTRMVMRHADGVESAGNREEEIPELSADELAEWVGTRTLPGEDR